MAKIEIIGIPVYFGGCPTPFLVKKLIDHGTFFLDRMLVVLSLDLAGELIYPAASGSNTIR